MECPGIDGPIQFIVLDACEDCVGLSQEIRRKKLYEGGDAIIFYQVKTLHYYIQSRKFDAQKRRACWINGAGFERQQCVCDKCSIGGCVSKVEHADLKRPIVRGVGTNLLLGWAYVHLNHQNEKFNFSACRTTSVGFSKTHKPCGDVVHIDVELMLPTKSRKVSCL